MKLESHTPPQIDPPVETVAMLGLLLVKAMSAAMGLPDESSAIAEIVATSPSFNETVVGERTILAGVGVFGCFLRNRREGKDKWPLRVQPGHEPRKTAACIFPRRTKSWRTHESGIISYVKPSV